MLSESHNDIVETEYDTHTSFFLVAITVPIRPASPMNDKNVVCKRILMVKSVTNSTS